MRRVALLIDTQLDFGRGLVQGITQYAHFHGPWSFYHEPVTLTGSADRLRREHIDALVVMAANQEAADALAGTAPAVVVVAVGEPVAGHHLVCGDYENDGQTGAQYLLERGFRRFAFSGMRTSWSAARYHGFRAAVEAAGFQAEFIPHFGDEGAASWVDEHQRMAERLLELPKPLALMACNDQHARRVLEACKTAGIKVPAELAVLGVDNDEMICRLAQPQLSSVAVNTQQAGYEVGALIDETFSGKAVAHRTITINTVGVVTRQSTDIIAVEDADVAAAVDYIRRHCRHPIQVADILEVVPVTRRTLESKFRQHLGHSVYQEIRRARVNLACQMLLDTNHSILYIARSLGFTGGEHIARYFRKEKGMTLLEYRRKFRGDTE